MRECSGISAFVLAVPLSMDASVGQRKECSIGGDGCSVDQNSSPRSASMNDSTGREPANDPQDLERLLVERENAGDVAGMTALFEPDAVVDIGGGTFLRGKEAIHEFFTKLQVTGFGPEKRKFEFGEQRPALICGDLALTSTRSRNGTVTSEVARRQKDGTWLWVIDRYSVSW